MMSGMGCIIAAILGIFWTIGASKILSSSDGAVYSLGQPYGTGSIGTIFSLFGVLFTLSAIACAIYNFKNATSGQRYSEYDITDSDEEPDPMNERYAQKASSVHKYESAAVGKAFCPYCGIPVGNEYRFCSSCGKKLPSQNER